MGLVGRPVAQRRVLTPPVVEVDPATDAGSARPRVRPRPSIEIRSSASAPVKAWLMNWPPWTPFCLSSGDSRSVDFPAALSDEREDLSGEVTLQGSNGVEFGMPFGYPTSNIVLGSLVGP